jgi:hypothetical protein
MMPTVESKLVSVACRPINQNERGVELIQNGRSAWVPRRLIVINRDGTVTMPEWLATDRGFA